MIYTGRQSPCVKQKLNNTQHLENKVNRQKEIKIHTAPNNIFDLHF